MPKCDYLEILLELTKNKKPGENVMGQPILLKLKGQIDQLKTALSPKM
jgi:hypothetical protein